MKKSKASFLLILPLTLLGACSQGAIASSENSKPSSSPSNLPESHPTSSSKGNSSIAHSISSGPSSSSMPTPSSSEEEKETHTQSPFEYPERPIQNVNPNADYSFEPIIPTELATINIVSDTGNNDFVTTPNRLNKPDYTSCRISVSSSEAEYSLNEVSGWVKVRGNYTANYDKKPLRIKFDKKQNLLGLNNGLKAKSWVLLADVKDSSLLRNASAFYLGHKILGSDGYYTTDFMPVKVNINGSFWGTYLLVEQQQVGNGRIDISEAEESWTTNDFGYFVEYDGYYTEEGANGDPTFTLNYANNSPLNGPNGNNVYAGNKGYTLKSDIYLDSQRVFASTYLENLYRLSYYATKGTYYDLSQDGLSLVRTSASTASKHINRYIDLQSLVDTYILNEIACDPDIGWSSFYLDFDMGEGKDHRLRFEAPWDWDSAFGNRSGFCDNARGYYAYGSGNPWLNLLTGQSFFQNMVRAKWAQLIENNVFQSLFATMHLYSSLYQDDYEANFARWNHLGGNYDLTSGELRDEAKSVYSEDDARRYLEDWLGDRLTYLSSVYGDGSDLHCNKAKNESAPIGSTKHRLEAESGTIFGNAAIKSDSTASGGRYIGNLDLTTNSGTRWTYNSSNSSKAYLSYGLAKQINSRDPSEMFELKVNGETIIFPERRNNASNTDNRYHDWGEVYMGEIDLDEGQNTIEIKSRGSSTNFDYLDLYTL